MAYALIAPPPGEAVSLAEVKAHLRLDDTTEDTLLLSLIATARDHLERTTGLALLSQTLRLYLDHFPKNGVIQIGRGPVQSIEGIVVYDATGGAVDVSLEGHRLDGQSRPARLTLVRLPAPGVALNGIEVDFVAGFGATAQDVPDALKRAMLLHVAHMFAFRGVLTPDQQPAGLPAGYERLVAPYEWRRL